MSDIVERLRRTLSDLPGNDDDLFNEIHAQRDEAADKIERLRSALSATLIVAEKLCEALDVDMSETSFRVKIEKSGEILGRVSLADILQSGRDALGEEEKS